MGRVPVQNWTSRCGGTEYTPVLGTGISKEIAGSTPVIGTMLTSYNGFYRRVKSVGR